jgi:hypothetical protein
MSKDMKIEGNLENNIDLDVIREEELRKQENKGVNKLSINSSIRLFKEMDRDVFLLKNLNKVFLKNEKANNLMVLPIENQKTIFDDATNFSNRTFGEVRFWAPKSCFNNIYRLFSHIIEKKRPVTLSDSRLYLQFFNVIIYLILIESP